VLGVRRFGGPGARLVRLLRPPGDWHVVQGSIVHESLQMSAPA